MTFYKENRMKQSERNLAENRELSVVFSVLAVKEIYRQISKRWFKVVQLVIVN